MRSDKIRKKKSFSQLVGNLVIISVLIMAIFSFHYRNRLGYDNVERTAYRFLEFVAEGEYDKAYQYTDKYKINIQRLKEINPLVNCYRTSAPKERFVFGVVPENEKTFWITCKNTKWDPRVDRLELILKKTNEKWLIYSILAKWNDKTK